MKPAPSTQQPATRIRSFRVVKKQNNDMTYFINTNDPQDFYVAEDVKHLVSEKKIYTEDDLIIEGSFVRLKKRLIDY